MNIDLQGLTLIGLVALGTVNVIGFFKPDMDSKMKFGLSFLVALIVTFVPPELQSVFADKVKLAIEATLSASAIYKLSQNPSKTTIVNKTEPPVVRGNDQ